MHRHDGAMASLMVAPGGRASRTHTTDELRQVARDIFRMGGARTLGAVVALEAGGFWQAAARVALSGIRVVAQPPFPTEVTGSRAAALDWLCPRLAAPGGPCVPRAALEAAVEHLASLPWGAPPI